MLICIGTMHHVLYCDTPAYILLGTGQHMSCSGTGAEKHNKEAEAVIALAQRDHQLARRRDCHTDRLADEQDWPSELAVVLPRSRWPLQPHPHTTHAHFWRVRGLDVKNTTLGLLVPEHRQGSYPVPCRWKDEPG